MSIIGEFKCPKCGWIHVGISEADAISTVADFNAYFATLSTTAQADFGGKPASLERYKRCCRCGTPAASFVPAVPDDAPDGCTLQVVIAPDMARRTRVCRECARACLGPSVVGRSTWFSGDCDFCGRKRGVCPADDFAERSTGTVPATCQPFRGLPLTATQDAEVREYIEHCNERREAWDTLQLDHMLREFINPPVPDALDFPHAPRDARYEIYVAFEVCDELVGKFTSICRGHDAKFLHAQYEHALAAGWRWSNEQLTWVFSEVAERLGFAWPPSKI